MFCAYVSFCSLVSRFTTLSSLLQEARERAASIVKAILQIFIVFIFVIIFHSTILLSESILLC